MTVQPPNETPEPANPETGWVPVDADRLKAGPSDGKLPPPLIVTGPLDLNTHELSPEAFEQLSYHIAYVIDSASDVHKYGVRGQKQHGIDLVTFHVKESSTIYQVKRYQEFSAGNLTEAVEDCAQGSSPFKFTRLVVIVSCHAHKTSVIERLYALRENYSDFTIELWDRTRLSQILFDQPKIVRRFFGQVICDQFCGPKLSTIGEQITPIDPNDILNGPICNMNLDDDHKKAKGLLKNNPFAAAIILEEIAKKLEESPFTAHTTQLRREQASALEAADQVEPSLRIKLDIAWRLIDSGDLWTVTSILREMNSSKVELPDDLQRSARSLAEVVRLRGEHIGSVDGLAARFDEMKERDLHRHSAAVALAEESIIAQEIELIRSRSSILTQIAELQQDNIAGQIMTARILTAIADATGNWHGLLTTAHKYDPTVEALILARYARFSALSSNHEVAVTCYQKAIRHSINNQMFGDARSWLYALRTIKVWYMSFESDTSDIHHRAQVLGAHGIKRILPTSNAHEVAMQALLKHKWPDALEALRHYHWHSVVTASWTEEFEANELIGDVFAETNHTLDAARHYIKAGHREKAEKLGANLAEESLDLNIDILGNPYWERAAAYKLVAQASDLLTEASAKIWTSEALNDAIENTTKLYPKDLFGVDAFDAFAALSDVTSDDDANRFLRFAAQFIDREPGHYQITDKSHIRALMKIAENSTKMRRAALQQALELLLVTNQLSWSAFLEKDELLKSEVQLVEELFSKPAANGNQVACLGLIAAGADTSPVLTHARTRVTAAIAKRDHDSGGQNIGTSYGLDAVLASVLNPAEQEMFVRGMMVVANDTAEPSLNRRDALLAAAQLVSDLSLDLKSELYKEAIKFARGDHDPRLPTPFEGSDDPLNRFQFNMELRSLRPSGLYCAAYCAVSDEEIGEVRGLALDLLRQDDENTPAYVAHALGVLALELASETVEALSVHSDERIRAAAAVAWARSTHPPAIGQALAKDSSALVRRSLAKELQDRPEHLPIREVLLNDPRRSIRSIVRPN